MAGNPAEGLELDLYTDEPVDNEKDDKFGHKYYADILMKVLKGKTKTPYNIGLFGKWGIGKSSILELLEKRIKEHNRCNKQLKFNYVYIDAMRLAKNALRQGIVEEVNIQTVNKDGIVDKLYNTKEEMKKAKPKRIIQSAILASIFALVLAVAFEISIGIPDKFLTVIQLLTLFIAPLILGYLAIIIQSSKRTIPAVVSAHQFKLIYDDIVKDTQAKKFIVVIDNLDRCENDIAFELLAITHTFMNQKNCINIFACDDIRLAERINNTDERQNSKEYSYLDKFFQVKIRIVTITDAKFRDFLRVLINNKPEFHSAITTLVAGTMNDPRKIKLRVNNLIMSYSLASVIEDSTSGHSNPITTHIDFLAKITVIKFEWPNFYHELEKDSELLKKIEISLFKPNQEKIDINQFSGLEEYLRATRNVRVDDIRPFLQLSQESITTSSDVNVLASKVMSYDVKGIDNIIKKFITDEDITEFKPYAERMSDMSTRSAPRLFGQIGAILPIHLR